MGAKAAIFRAYLDLYWHGGGGVGGGGGGGFDSGCGGGCGFSGGGGDCGGAAELQFFIYFTQTQFEDFIILPQICVIFSNTKFATKQRK